MTKDKAGKDAKQPAADKADGQGKKTKAEKPAETVEEIGGRDGPDPTRYGDWERKGILSDF